MTFESSMKKVEEIISKLESNEISLEDSIQIYNEGLNLIGNCKKQLDEAEILITVDDSEN